MKPTNELMWRGYQKNNPSNIRLRHEIMGADIDSNGALRLKRLDGENIVCLVVHQADTTNNPDALVIVQEGTGDAIAVKASASGSDVFTVDKSGNVVAGGRVTAENLTLANANTETLSGDKTIAAGDPQIQFLDPGGASRTVTLPSAAEGLFFIIVNTADAAEDLTISDGASTVVTISQNEAGLVVSDGTSWKGFVGANT